MNIPLLNDLHFPFYSPLFRGTKYANHVRKHWALATTAANLSIEQGRKVRIPRLSQIQIASEDGDQISAIVDMATVGSTSRALAQRIETVTASLHAYSTRVERIDPALARITINFSPPHHPRPRGEENNVLDLEQYPIHLDQVDTNQASIYLTKSILIGGESESGKSNLVWYILSQLNTSRIPYRLWVIDPAGGVELTDLDSEKTALTRHYVDRIGDIPKIVDKFRESMDNRLALMKRRGVRRHFPTRTEPVEILIIDELLMCKGQLKGGEADSPLGEILSVGRKALHIVIGCSQLGEKLVIGQIRDLFPQRVCLRTRSQDITDAVLGSNATVDGAVCHRITNRGEGYVFVDGSEVFEKFQAPLVRETATIAQGGTTAPVVTLPNKRTLRRRSGRTFVYQFYNVSDPNHPYYRRPCYVGITDNPRRRLKQHERDWPSSLWNQVIPSRTKITAYSSWDEAKAKETQLIDYYQPIFNVQETR
jgi:DNA segregation ATPase FtsK/SpoIIIE, S-DNA-T family